MISFIKLCVIFDKVIGSFFDCNSARNSLIIFIVKSLSHVRNVISFIGLNFAGFNAHDFVDTLISRNHWRNKVGGVYLGLFIRQK